MIKGGGREGRKVLAALSEGDIAELALLAHEVANADKVEIGGNKDHHSYSKRTIRFKLEKKFEEL